MPNPFDVAAHGADLYNAYAENEDSSMWTYMPKSPFANEADFLAWMGPACESEDPLFHTLIDTSTGKPVGQASYMRITPDHGVIEVGNIAFSPRLQRTPIATEAMFMMMQSVFNELGYRRLRMEMRFLQRAVGPRSAAGSALLMTASSRMPSSIKAATGTPHGSPCWTKIGRRSKKAYETWLSPDNFEADGQQKERLSQTIERFRKT